MAQLTIKQSEVAKWHAGVHERWVSAFDFGMQNGIREQSREHSCL
jgi:hypothetical protein